MAKQKAKTVDMSVTDEDLAKIELPEEAEKRRLKELEAEEKAEKEAKKKPKKPKKTRFKKKLKLKLKKTWPKAKPKKSIPAQKNTAPFAISSTALKPILSRKPLPCSSKPPTPNLPAPSLSTW
jgi:hypothetical protein